MKKIYSKPQTDIIRIDAPQVLTMSDELYPDLFGQLSAPDSTNESIPMA